MKEHIQNQQDEALPETSNEEEPLSWKNCPVCERGNSRSPEFRQFMPRVRHLIEHETGIPEIGEQVRLIRPIDRHNAEMGLPPHPYDPRPQRTKVLNTVRKFLPAIASWIELALQATPQLAILRGDILTPEKLVAIVKSLPNQFEEQRRHLLRHEDVLRDTGQDPKWPGTPDGKARFVSESMAGAEWDLTPSSSREFVRRAKPRARPARDKRKPFERRVLRQDGRPLTDKDYDN